MLTFANLRLTSFQALEIMQLKHAQLLDELAILWVVMACYWLWYPEFALPPPYR